jgi:hypothetical protein
MNAPRRVTQQPLASRLDTCSPATQSASTDAPILSRLSTTRRSNFPRVLILSASLTLALPNGRASLLGLPAQSVRIAFPGGKATRREVGCLSVACECFKERRMCRLFVLPSTAARRKVPQPRSARVLVMEPSDTFFTMRQGRMVHRISNRCLQAMCWEVRTMGVL